MGLGASSVEGCGDATGGGFLRRLAVWLALRAPGVTVVNRGIGGQKVRDMLARLDGDLDAADPDLIIFLPGINDIPRGDGQARTALGAYTADMRLILGRCAARCPTLYVGPFRPDCARLGIDPALLGSYLGSAGDVARGLGVPILDLRDLVPEARLGQFWYRDGLHFNDLGHQFICDLLRAYLERQYPLGT
jgi:lysophospholipase L1-like esterase